jgi:hypothetical protein
VEAHGLGPDGEDARRPHGRAVLLILLPVVFLGAAYFLLVEYLLREVIPAGSSLWLTLRLGGAGLIVLALALAGAFGYLVVERLMRPLRLLLRVAETSEVAPGPPPWLRGRAWEVHDLYRLLSVLVSQNKAGARAMEELEQLRIALAHFREEVTRTGQHGIIPEVHAAGPLAEIGASLQTKRANLLGFFSDLRERVAQVAGEVDRLGAAVGPSAGGEERAPGESPEVERIPETEMPPAADGERREESALRVVASVDRLRQYGTVLALETARAAGLPGSRAGELFARFESGLDDLEKLVSALAASNGGARDRTADLETEAASLREAYRSSWRRLAEAVELIERRLVEVEER